MASGDEASCPRVGAGGFVQFDAGNDRSPRVGLTIRRYESQPREALLSEEA